ncbi:MAG: hypothetical protein R2807_08545 [Chitinophagales bacterium]
MRWQNIHCDALNQPPNPQMKPTLFVTNIKEMSCEQITTFIKVDGK